MCERPVPETDRLRLQPRVPAGCARIRALAGDRHIADATSKLHPHPAGPAEERVADRRRAWRSSGSPALAVTRRDATGSIGVASLHTTDDGGEAARAKVDYGLGRHGLSRINARRVSRNRAPAPIIEGLAFRHVARHAGGFARRGRPEAVEVYLLDRTSWSAAEAGR